MAVSDPSPNICRWMWCGCSAMKGFWARQQMSVQGDAANHQRASISYLSVEMANAEHIALECQIIGRDNGLRLQHLARLCGSCLERLAQRERPSFYLLHRSCKPYMSPDLLQSEVRIWRIWVTLGAVAVAECLTQCNCATNRLPRRPATSLLYDA